jgi:hypothetical protein
MTGATAAKSSSPLGSKILAVLHPAFLIQLRVRLQCAIAPEQALLPLEEQDFEKRFEMLFCKQVVAGASHAVSWVAVVPHRTI